MQVRRCDSATLAICSDCLSGASCIISVQEFVCVHELGRVVSGKQNAARANDGLILLSAGLVCEQKNNSVCAHFWVGCDSLCLLLINPSVSAAN